MNQLTFENKQFFLDGKPFRILSGAIHYFRVHPDLWEDRLKKLKACGFNTVETYCCWNLHEKQEGQFDFTGFLDIRRFLKTAQDVGLYAIVRPGPYICAEWDYGGLPYWLNRYPMHIRCYDELYLSKVRSYFEQLCGQLLPQMGCKGGNVIAMQIENEYGSYGNDQQYLNAIVDMYQDFGMDCLYFTSDGANALNLTNGTLPEHLATCNFGSQAAQRNQVLSQFRPDSPFMCMEFWNGWFDHWGNHNSGPGPEETVRYLEEILDQNNGQGNVNFYMFHGGTNFGFTSGANQDGHYLPTVTSYDYGAPVTEWGDLTEKYYLVKACLEKRYGPAEDIPVSNPKKAAYGTVKLTKKAGLFQNLNNLGTPVTSAYTQTFEDLKLPCGFVLYSTELRGTSGGEHPIHLDGMRDRALIYVNGELKGIQEAYSTRNDEVTVSFSPENPVRLDILVENMGRVNYGKDMGEKKGIAQGVRINYLYHSGWTMYPMELIDLSKLDYSGCAEDQPAFYSGEFTAEEPCNTFLRLDGFTKGVAFINGFNLGRYWNTMGPQKTLYIPGPLVKKGVNQLIIFELEHTDTDCVLLTDIPDLG